MSEQAIENEGEIEALEVVDTDEQVTDQDDAKQAKAEETSDEVEIVIDGEEEPTSKPVRKSGFYKRLHRLTNQRDEAQSREQEAIDRANALEQENQLYRMQLEQSSAKRPRPEDFDSDEDFESAKAKYDQEQQALHVQKLVDEQVSKRLQETQSQTTQTQTDRALEAKTQEHDARAAKLNVADYDETEDAAIEILGDDLSKTIVSNTDKSELLMYYLGKNPAKAESLKSLSVQNPVGCVLEIGRLEEKLKIKPKHSPAANPEVEVDRGLTTYEEGPLAGARFE